LVERGNSPASMPRSGSDTDLDGYDTYPPTPEHREYTPAPEDPWERLDHNRVIMEWDEEKYQFEKFFLKEVLIDEARKKCDDEKGDRERDAELEDIRRSRYIPGTQFQSSEYSIRMRQFNDRSKGVPTEAQIEAQRKANAAYVKLLHEQPNYRASALVPGVDAVTREEMVEIHRQWDSRGLSKETQAETVRMLKMPNIMSSETDKDAKIAVQSQESNHRPPPDALHRTTSGRITKSATVPQRRSGGRRGGRATQAVLRSAESPPSDRQRRSSRNTVPNEHLNNRQTAAQDCRKPRKTYKKERASRRLAGQQPEFGMLPEQGETARPYEDSRQRSNTRNLGSSGPRSSRLRKEPSKVKGAEPQGISKAKRSGPPKKSTKRLKA